MGNSKNGMYRPIIISINLNRVLAHYRGYTSHIIYCVYLAVNKFREFYVFKKIAKINLHKNWIFIEMGVAHECLSMKDGHLNEVSEYLRNYLSINVHQVQIRKI